MEDLIQKWKSARLPSRQKVRGDIKRLTAKKNRQINELADKTHDEVFKHIDCLDCANCCTSIPPMLVPSDVKRISKHLNLKEKEFTSQYLRRDEDGDMVMTQSPCTFLGSDNKCEIYDVRPKACRQYPHTDAGEFRKNGHLHVDNVFTCPAVYHIVEQLKEVV
jgi:Fe-S-cluster containining protein